MKSDFVKSEKFFGRYIIITLIILLFTLISYQLSLLLPFFKTIMEIDLLVGIPLLFGQILLIFVNANRNDKMGCGIIRFTYITLIIICFSFMQILFSAFLYSVSPDPLLSQDSARLLAAYSFGVCLTFGICLSIICHFTLSTEHSWSFSKLSKLKEPKQ